MKPEREGGEGRERKGRTYSRARLVIRDCKYEVGVCGFYPANLYHGAQSASSPLHGVRSSVREREKEGRGMEGKGERCGKDAGMGERKESKKKAGSHPPKPDIPLLFQHQRYPRRARLYPRTLYTKSISASLRLDHPTQPPPPHPTPPGPGEGRRLGPGYLEPDCDTPQLPSHLPRRWRRFAPAQRRMCMRWWFRSLGGPTVAQTFKPTVPVNNPMMNLRRERTFWFNSPPPFGEPKTTVPSLRSLPANAIYIVL